MKIFGFKVDEKWLPWIVAIVLLSCILTASLVCNAQTCTALQLPPGVARGWASTPTPHPAGYSKTVGIYFECDYTIYQHFAGDTDAERQWVQNIFAEVQKIYRADSILIYIDSFGIWTVPDPYQNLTSGSARLLAFGQRMSTIKPTADLFHLLSLTPYNLGGVSFVGVLGASNEYKVSFSNIYQTYNLYPVYSWTAEVIAHECGHALNSQHTQWCGWQGGPIDTCYTPEGGCYTGANHPIQAGTIMSYCHLNGAINFNYGFGQLPRECIRQNIWDTYSNGILKNPYFTDTNYCLPPPSVTITNITDKEAFISWQQSPGAINYKIKWRKNSETQWQSEDLPFTSKWLTGLTPNTVYKIQLKSNCGTMSAPTLAKFKTQ